MSRDLSAHAAWLAPHLTVIRPDGAGPFPVVAQMHGCAGCGRIQTLYAEAAREAGVAAVIIDSLAPRGLGRIEAGLTVCTGLRLRGAERATDLLAVLAWLERQPWADTGRLAAAGWSHGGWSVMEALVAGSPQALALKLAVLFHPYAGLGAHTARSGWGDARPTVIAILAGRDRIVGRAAPTRALARLRADGLRVETLEFADATHAFDDEFAHDPRFVYRPDLLMTARRVYAHGLRTTLIGAAESEAMG